MGHRLFVLLLVVSPLGAAAIAAEEPETVAVIGTGDMGDSVGPRLAGLGYTVIYGSRDPKSERVAALVRSTGNGASAALPADAAADADIVLLAVPWPAMETSARNLGDLDGKSFTPDAAAAVQIDTLGTGFNSNGQTIDLAIGGGSFRVGVNRQNAVATINSKIQSEKQSIRRRLTR